MERSKLDHTSFDRYARMVRHALDVPTALVTLLHDDHQEFLGALGLPEPWQTKRETPLTHSFCQYVVQDARPLLVSDARLDPRVRDNGAIQDLGVVAYVGWPLTDHTGTVVGSLCAIDSQPREWSAEQLAALEDLAASCSIEIAQRALSQMADRSERETGVLLHRSAVLLALSENLVATETLSDVAAAVEMIATRHLGCLRAGLWLRDNAASEDPAIVDHRTRSLAHQDLVLTLPPGTEWASAEKHSTLSIDRSNPMGDVLLDNRAVFFTSREAHNARYPGLANPEQIGEARAVMPLAVAGRAFGAMLLLWADERYVDDDDRVTIAALTSYTSQAVQRALLLEDRNQALLTLQTAMLTRLPQVADLELTARYRPAQSRDQVGGDWYDAVTLSSGSTCLIIGDVVGHDIAAAAVMGELRSMLRALAWSLPDDPPSDHVCRLDQAVADLGVDALATLVLARVEAPDTDHDGVRRLLWTNAGHPPPLLVEADGTTRFLTERNDCMLGVLPGGSRHDSTAEIPVGSTVLLYTDGLIERRGEDLNLGLARLAAAAAARHGSSLDKLVDGILDELDSDVNDDDIAILAVRVRPS